jgi:DNA-binding MarR family transcriptional regulator
LSYNYLRLLHREAKNTYMRKITTIKTPTSSNTNSVDQDLNLWALFRQTREAMFKARGKELEKYGISSTQAAVLFTIQNIGKSATPAEISRRLIREPHSISGLLSRMEKQGIIKRVKDLPKRNMLRISLTAKGKELYKLTAKRDSMHEVFAVMSPEEKNILWGYLERLRDRSLKLAGIGYEMPFPPHRPDSEDD